MWGIWGSTHSIRGVRLPNQAPHPYKASMRTAFMKEAAPAITMALLPFRSPSAAEKSPRSPPFPRGTIPPTYNKALFVGLCSHFIGTGQLGQHRKRHLFKQRDPCPLWQTPLQRPKQLRQRLRSPRQLPLCQRRIPGRLPLIRRRKNAVQDASSASSSAQVSSSSRLPPLLLLPRPPLCRVLPPPRKVPRHIRTEPIREAERVTKMLQQPFLSPSAAAKLPILRPFPPGTMHNGTTVLSQITSSIISTQSTSVNAVSSATHSSSGIISAVKAAFAQSTGLSRL